MTPQVARIYAEMMIRIAITIIILYVSIKYQDMIIKTTIVTFTMYTCMHVCMHVCMYIYIIHMYMYVYIYIYIYIYVYHTMDFDDYTKNNHQECSDSMGFNDEDSWLL